MSTSNMVIYPANPLLPNPGRSVIIAGLRKNGFLADMDCEWKNPHTGLIEIHYKPGTAYMDFVTPHEDFELTPSDFERAIIAYEESEMIDVKVCAPGEFKVSNPETGTVMAEDWGNELGAFLENNDHKWKDPANNKAYYFFELECSDIGLGKHFIILDDSLGKPNQKLMQLLNDLTGMEYKWMWTKI